MPNFNKGRRKPGMENKPKRIYKIAPQYTPDKSSAEEMRLNRFLANAGVCSRRDADELIQKGEVKVNGKVVSELGIKVSPKDKVEYKGELLNAEKKVYILLNKPKDVVTTLEDPNAKRTVIDIIKHACKERVYPVGRLDRMTTGVLLLTNDGELTKRLTHPKYNRKKIYHVYLDKPFTKNDLIALHEGFELEDGFIKADAASYIPDKSRNEVGVEIHSGKNRIVRRMFAHLGYKVEKLDRVYFGGLTKQNLPRGKWRFLEDKEVQMLKMTQKQKEEKNAKRGKFNNKQ